MRREPNKIVMNTKKRKTKMARVSMSREQMSFALFAFRKVVLHELFASVRIRLTDALQDMGLDSRSQEFDEAMKQYEILFSKTMLDQTKQL